MGIDLIVHVLFLFVFCLILATMETQIEGAFGWAQNLPTWKPDGKKWYVKLYGKIMGGRNLTGYHLAIFSLVLLFIHYPFFSGKPWSMPSEMSALSFFFLVVVVWDFLWFVINPKYNFLDFWQKKVWWHKKWFLHLPADYWYAFLISAILYVQLPFDISDFFEWLFVFGLFLLMTVVVMLSADLGGILRNRNDSR